MKKGFEGIRKRRRVITFVAAIGIIVPVYYILRAILARGYTPNANWWYEFLDTFTFTVILSFILYSASTAICRRLEKVLPWREHGSRRFIIELLLISANAIVISSIVSWLYFKYIKGCDDVQPIIFEVDTIALVINTIATAIYEAIYLFRQWKEALVNGEKLKQENLQSQFEALKNQVNPHFLFNSLNTLATIIPEDPKQAVKFVQKLSSVYRYLLQYKDNELVDLKTELDCIRAYLFLQQIRFGENLKAEINIPENIMHRGIPPLTLQILVENAIKHNIISGHKPLTVSIYIDDAGLLVVKNNLQRKKAVESSTKIGLQNLVNRYRYLMNREIDIFETETDFIVKLPLAKN